MATNTNLAYIDKLDKESIQNLTNLYNQQGIHSGALTDMTSQFKQNTGRDNTIGTTIGNASLNNYGYSVVNVDSILIDVINKMENEVIKNGQDFWINLV